MKYEFKNMASHDPRYPQFMRDMFGGLAPPDIWYLGNIELLLKRSVGFCGSRKATEAGLEVTRDCASQLVESDVVVTSGYAAGVDMTSHIGAIANGGETIVVLAEGADNFRIKKEIKPFWNLDKILILSYFPRNAIWRADRAMDRNRAIVSISNAVVVVEAGDTGGTLNAGYVALKQRKPLFVVTFGDMSGSRGGNRKLLEEGASPLMRSRATGRAQIKPLLDRLSS